MWYFKDFSYKFSIPEANGTDLERVNESDESKLNHNIVIRRQSKSDVSLSDDHYTSIRSPPPPSEDPGKSN